MADLDVSIAGRSYRVACADGEEQNLGEAARLVAAEAESLREQFGSRFAALPESRVLLMASLMLGDRFRALLAQDAAAGRPAPEAPAQRGFFEDSGQSARVAELEAALAAAQSAEAAAIEALEAATAQVRSLAADIHEDLGDAALDDDADADEEDAPEDAFEEAAQDGAETAEEPPRPEPAAEPAAETDPEIDPEADPLAEEDDASRAV